MQARPNIFEYLEYREFLKQMVAYRRSEDEFTVRSFAEQVGFGSSSHFKMILDGERSITKKNSKKIARALELTEKETTYFLHLIAFNQARSLEEKDAHFLKLKELKTFSKSQALTRDQYDFFAHWYVVAILEGLSTKWREKSQNEMAASLGITERELRGALDLLCRLRLIEQSGRLYRPLNASVETPDAIQGLSLRNFYREMIARGFSCIDDHPVEVREVGSLTLALSQEELEEIRVKFQTLRRELNERYSSSQNPKKVFQINYQLFPLFDVED